MKALRLMLLASFLVAGAGVADAFPVAPERTLGQLDTDADLVFKGTVISTGTLTVARSTSGNSGPSHSMQADLIETLTHFKVVSVIKGDRNIDAVTYSHYDGQYVGGPRSRPIFEPGRTYLVFARKAGASNLYEQLQKSISYRNDEGILRCLDARPVTARTIQEIVWNELAAMLRSKDAADVENAVTQLDKMSSGDESRGRREGLDFQRQDVTELVQPLIIDPNAVVAQTAIALIGSHNPYMNEKRAINWLATVGAVPLPGVSPLASQANGGGPAWKQVRNNSGALYWRELASVADGKADAVTRAFAITALGLVRNPALEKHLDRWLADGSGNVRAAAAVLLADYPALATRERIESLAADPDNTVVAAAARSIGFAQRVEFADILSRLLQHPDRNVRKYAAMSFLTFSPHNPDVAALMVKNLDNPVFGKYFAVALAAEDAEKYLGRLATIALDAMPPADEWWGGTTPGDRARTILFDYLETEPPEILLSGKYGSIFDTLDKTKDAEFRKKLTAFYKRQGMEVRAKKISK